jgi:hypothetical protein
MFVLLFIHLSGHLHPDERPFRVAIPDHPGPVTVDVVVTGDCRAVFPDHRSRSETVAAEAGTKDHQMDHRSRCAVCPALRHPDHDPFHLLPGDDDEEAAIFLFQYFRAPECKQVIPDS